MRSLLSLVVLGLGVCAPHAGTAAPPASKTGARDTTFDATTPVAWQIADQPSQENYRDLQNLFKITDRIYCGGEPERDEAFGELARLGIRTVVSVDGARPRLELAEKHGLRYVHIPIGYDGIPDQAGKSLAALVARAEGPFYIHCHHGRHRGPAAAAVAAIADGGVDRQAAVAILEKAGTSQAYSGLWRDVAAYRPPSEQADLPALVASADVGSLASAMAGIDRVADVLDRCRDAGWQTPVDHPDISPARVALLLKEGFHESVRRLRESPEYDERFVAWLSEAEDTAARLESALRNGDGKAASSFFGLARNQCVRCHGDYRDQSESRGHMRVQRRVSTGDATNTRAR